MLGFNGMWCDVGFEVMIRESAKPWVYQLCQLCHYWFESKGFLVGNRRIEVSRVKQTSHTYGSEGRPTPPPLYRLNIIL